MMAAEKENGNIGSLAQELETFVHDAAREGRPLYDVERAVFDRVLRIGRAAINTYIEDQGNGDLGPTVTTQEGTVLQRSDEPSERPLRTIFGEHTIDAFVYAPGPKRKLALRPIDARMGLPEGKFSYLFEEFSQYFCVESAFGESRNAFALMFGQTVCVDSLERLNRRLGEQAEAFLEALPTPPPDDEGELLIATADSKGVPLVKPDAERLPVFCNRERPGNRRMATLGSVYSVDRYVRTPEEIVAALFREERRQSSKVDRPRPQFKYLTACFSELVEDGPETVSIAGPVKAFTWIAEQVRQRRRPDQRLIVLTDGDRNLADAADACLGEVPADQTVDILDLLHVAGYVWRAAKVFHSAFEYRETFARERLLRILKGETAGVIAGLRQMATKRDLEAADRKEIDTVCTYFENNRDRMRYDEYLREGYPIATGVIEGACRHLVKDRMERSGMRWVLEGAGPMLQLRAAYQSTSWDQFHAFRIAQEQPLLHPHLDLMSNYRPLSLPC